MTTTDRSGIARPYPSRCILCGGPVEEQVLTLPYTGENGSVRVVRGVPVGVCRVCGERYLRPEVAARIDELLARPADGNEEFPVWDFAAAH